MSFTLNYYVNSEFTMALICINPYADYAANSSVYQPECKEAIFNSLEKHTCRKTFRGGFTFLGLFNHMLSMQGALMLKQWIIGEKVCGEIQSFFNEPLISTEEAARRV